VAGAAYQVRAPRGGSACARIARLRGQAARLRASAAHLTYTLQMGASFPLGAAHLTYTLQMGASCKRAPLSVPCKPTPPPPTHPPPAPCQTEGAIDADGRSVSVWDYYVKNNPDKIRDGSNATVTTDFYHRYKEDIALMKSLGIKNYRWGFHGVQR
jgi:hypothetical protein